MCTEYLEDIDRIHRYAFLQFLMTNHYLGIPLVCCQIGLLNALSMCSDSFSFWFQMLAGVRQVEVLKARIASLYLLLPTSLYYTVLNTGRRQSSGKAMAARSGR